MAEGTIDLDGPDGMFWWRVLVAIHPNAMALGELITLSSCAQRSGDAISMSTSARRAKRLAIQEEAA